MEQGLKWVRVGRDKGKKLREMKWQRLLEGSCKPQRFYLFKFFLTIIRNMFYLQDKTCLFDSFLSWFAFLYWDNRSGMYGTSGGVGTKTEKEKGLGRLMTILFQEAELQLKEYFLKLPFLNLFC